MPHAQSRHLILPFVRQHERHTRATRQGVRARIGTLRPQCTRASVISLSTDAASSRELPVAATAIVSVARRDLDAAGIDASCFASYDTNKHIFYIKIPAMGNAYRGSNAHRMISLAFLKSVITYMLGYTAATSPMPVELSMPTDISQDAWGRHRRTRKHTAGLINRNKQA